MIPKYKPGESSEPYTHNNTLCNVDWLGIEKGRTPVKSENKTVKQVGIIVNKDTIDVVLKYDIHIVARYNTPNMDRINNFFKQALLNNFYFIVSHGWSCIGKHTD